VASDLVIAVGEQTLRKEMTDLDLAGVTPDFFGSIPSMQSPWLTVSAPSSAPCDVIAARTGSCIAPLKESGETTNAGRLFEELRSVNGKETRTMSPRL
jgi:hypothetical protein